ARSTSTVDGSGQTGAGTAAVLAAPAAVAGSGGITRAACVPPATGRARRGACTPPASRAAPDPPVTNPEARSTATTAARLNRPVVSARKPHMASLPRPSGRGREAGVDSHPHGDVVDGADPQIDPARRAPVGRSPPRAADRERPGRVPPPGHRRGTGIGAPTVDIQRDVAGVRV